MNKEAIAVRMDAVSPESIRWLWPGRIPLGKLTMLVGDPGLGKSVLVLTIASYVSRGWNWPSDTTPCPKGDVVILSAEDDIPDTIRPRLDAAGADVQRIHALTTIRERGQARPFCLTRDIPALDRLIADRPECRLVGIDPVTAYLGSTDSHKNAEVRAVLMPLAELAARYKIAIVAVSHLNKGGHANALYRAMGSLAFVAAARSVLVVARDPENFSRRLLLPAKNNLAPHTTGIAFTITQGDNDAPVVQWEHGRVSLSADEALTPELEDTRSEREEAAEWLREKLSGRAIRATDMPRLAREAGFAWRTVERAKRLAGVRSKKVGDTWCWCLRSQDRRTTPDGNHGDLGGVGIVDDEDRQESQQRQQRQVAAYRRCPHCDGEGCKWCCTGTPTRSARH